MGTAIWCWPIEWYYQAAVRFNDITVTEQEKLRKYIETTTKQDYPDFVGEVTTEADDTESASEEENVEVLSSKRTPAQMFLSQNLTSLMQNFMHKPMQGAKLR